MQQKISGMSCQLGSWALAAGVGLLTTVLLLVIGDTSLLGALFLGGVAFVILGILFGWLFCRELPEARGPGNIDDSKARDTDVSAPRQSAKPAAAASGAAAASASAPAASAEPVASSADEKESLTSRAADSAEVKPDVQTANATADAEAGAQVSPSTPLPGQDELAARKGEWKYDGGDTGETSAKKSTSKPVPAAAAAAPKEAPAAASTTPDYDGDGKLEGEGEGTKPETLSQAREGGADNLKEIKGVGPKLEKLLNSMGFFHFDQIANWTADEISWVNANLEGFKGRATRDDWVGQAKILAAGGDTEFSKRVDKGDVY